MQCQKRCCNVAHPPYTSRIFLLAAASKIEIFNHSPCNVLSAREAEADGGNDDRTRRQQGKIDYSGAQKHHRPVCWAQKKGCKSSLLLRSIDRQVAFDFGKASERSVSFLICSSICASLNPAAATIGVRAGEQLTCGDDVRMNNMKREGGRWMDGSSERGRIQDRRRRRCCRSH